jgi:hypothetical protein
MHINSGNKKCYCKDSSAQTAAAALAAAANEVATAVAALAGNAEINLGDSAPPATASSRKAGAAATCLSLTRALFIIGFNINNRNSTRCLASLLKKN